MILAVDVDYRATGATVAGVLFHAWSDTQASQEITVNVAQVAPYISGQFYKRELPCILALLQQLPTQPKIIVVDGHVFLGAAQKAGLGKYLYDALGGKVAVIGVAKRGFKGGSAETHIYRGQSLTPLYVTAVGIPPAQARTHILTMAGNYRLPTLLKRVDQLCRSKSA